MEIILNYLESMFSELADTGEVRRVKQEMAFMMEEKYTALKAEGKSENEAIGTVIAEFGSVDELICELGIDKSKKSQESCYSHTEGMFSGRRVTKEECRTYIASMERLSQGIGAGVMLILVSLIFPVMGEEIFGEERGSALGVVLMFVLIAAAVVLFIINGVAMSRFDYLKKENLSLDESAIRMLEDMQQKDRPQFASKIAVGVLLCILSVIPVILNESVLHLAENIPPCILFVMVGSGVYLFITTGVPYGCYNVLMQREDYSPQMKKGMRKGEDFANRIGGIYWPCIVLIYLVYSLLTHDWGRSWIIWPAAGLFFVVIIATYSAFCSGKDKDF